MLNDALIRVTGLDWIDKARHSFRAPTGGHLGYRGGQFIPMDIVKMEQDIATDAMNDLLSDFSTELQFLRDVYEQSAYLQTIPQVDQSRVVPLGKIEWQMKRSIRLYYNRAFILGKRAAGNLFALSPGEEKHLVKVRRDEFRFLRNFLKDIREGGGVMDYARRMDMYRAAMREPFWTGWVAAQRDDAMINWILGPTEHCDSCLGFANHGPYTKAEFVSEVSSKGYVPQSGKLDCKGFDCQCSLRTSDVTVAEKPDWVAHPWRK